MHRLTHPSTPSALTQHVPITLRDGGAAAIRPLHAGEEAPLLAVFSQLSPRSRLYRYFVGISALSRGMISALVAVDGLDHVAWLASVDGEPVGIARYIRVGPATAEVALEIGDAHHGRGLGTALLDTVTTLASVNGVRRIEAAVLAENLPSRRLLGKFGVCLHATGSTLEGSGPLRLLDPSRVDRAAVVALAARDRDLHAGSDEPWTTADGSGH
jgi:RimJ/RimL family protein N-acetyltransferase